MIKICKNFIYEWGKLLFSNRYLKIISKKFFKNVLKFLFMDRESFFFIESKDVVGCIW